MDNSTIIDTDEINTLLKKAITELKREEYKKAYNLIIKAICHNPNAPEPHNLLGIWYEFKGNDDLARKHYRIAYVLNPIYRPSCENLERVSTLFSTRKIAINYGEIVENEAESDPLQSTCEKNER